MDGTVPSFAEDAGPGGLTYFVGAAIGALRLPEAGGGTGTLRYGLSPRVPGLTFNAATRELSGTPSVAGIYDMTYTAIDEAGNADSLAFAIEVQIARAAGDFGLASRQRRPAGDWSSPTGASLSWTVQRAGCTRTPPPENAMRRRTSTWTRTTVRPVGGRIRQRAVLRPGFDGGQALRVHRVSGERDSAADFNLDRGQWRPVGNRHWPMGDSTSWIRAMARSYAYAVSGERDSAGGLRPGRGAAATRRVSPSPTGDSTSWMQWRWQKVYRLHRVGRTRSSGRTSTWTRDNADPSGIAFANGRFHVADLTDDKVYAYTVSGERAARGDHGGVGNPDLAVASPTVSDSEPSAGGSFTVSVTVRNDGGAGAPATTLRFYRSADSVIGTGDEEVGANEVGGLAAFGTRSTEHRAVRALLRGHVLLRRLRGRGRERSGHGEQLFQFGARHRDRESAGRVRQPQRPNPPPRCSEPARHVETDTGNVVTLTWDPSPGATYYNIWRCHEFCILPDNWYKVAEGITATTWLDTTIGDVPPQTTILYYHVEPCNSVGCTPIFF